MNNESRNKYLYSFASVVTNIFHPVALLPILFIFLIHNFSGGQDLFLNVFIIFGFGLIPIIGYAIFLKKTGQIKDWDIRDRRQRYKLNIFTLFSGGLMIFILNFFGTRDLFWAILPVYIWFIFFTIITFWWKISAHAGGITLVCLLASKYYGLNIYWGALVIILIGWTRIYRKNHTVAQVIAGIILSLFIFSFYEFILRT